MEEREKKRGVNTGRIDCIEACYTLWIPSGLEDGNSGPTIVKLTPCPDDDDDVFNGRRP